MNAIRTTHVGSLVRPTALAAVLRRQAQGEAVDADEMQATLAHAITEVVRRQRAIGLDIINDGEFGKPDGWSRYVLRRLEGCVQRPLDPRTAGAPPAALFGKDMRDFAEFYAEYMSAENSRPVASGPWDVTGPLHYSGNEQIRRDIAELKAAVGNDPTTQVFMPAVAPASVVLRNWSQVYASEEAFLFALAEALREEYRAIVDAGLILQIDDAYLATMYDVMVPPSSLAEYRRWAELRVAALNHALVGIPESKTRYHVCWGSWNGPHTNDVPVAAIIDLILSVKVGGYSLEMANPRHEHEWQVWEKVKLPPGRVILPGVVSHCTNVVEHPELVAQRIVRLARLVGRENVIASTDCGFAQGPLVRRVHESIMWAKLQSLVGGARLATRELWGTG